MRNFLLLTFGFCTPTLAIAAMFSWTDQSGNLTFGDTPPEGVVVKEIIPPKLTVLEGFASRYGATGEEGGAVQAKENIAKSKAVVSTYEKLNIIAPKQGQAIRANDGDVSIAVALSPKLQKGDKLVFTLDGQQVQQSTLTVANMTNLDRGDHVLTVSVVDTSGKKIISSELVTFSVLRVSALNKTHFNPYESNESSESD